MSRDKRGQWTILNDTTIQDRTGREQFHFDRIFRPNETTNQIFESDLRNMMGNALKGYNVTVLAYGQTNSGKTFTIRGGLANTSQSANSKELAASECE